VNRRRVLSALPHAFTLGSLFCGFFAIAQSFHATGLDGLLRAALAILFGAFFDAFDGRIARITRTQSVLGLHLDSLADVVTFGVAPAALLYSWGLDQLGLVGLFIAFVWVACGAMRLARFNTLASVPHEGHGPGKYIVGLPIPAAAAVIVSLVVLAQRTGTVHAWSGRWGLAVVALTLSYLMVSRIRFRSFKAVAWRSRRTVVSLALIAALSAAVWIGLRGAYVFVFLLLAYIGIGLVEAMLRRTHA
jgi:CDP-diacylglycerol---serine O-phosphatidyltransferase